MKGDLLTKRRILMVGSVPLAAPWNGTDNNLARMLVRRDSQNHFTVQTDLEESWPSPHKVTAIRSRNASDMPTVAQKLRAFAYMLRHTGSADLIHVVASLHRPHKPTASAIRTWASLRRRPILHTVPSLGEIEVERRNFVGDATVVISDYARRRLIKGGVPNVFRVDPPLDLDVLRPREPRGPEDLRCKLGLGNRAVLYPTHFGEKSGIPEIVRAFSRLRGIDDAVLVLACRAHPWQDAVAEERKILNLAAEVGVLDRVRMVGGTVDMPALISACAMTALVPERLGGKMDLPLTILESLALGRPVLVNDRPPMNEALLGGGGYAIPHGDVPALAAAIQGLLEHPHLREELAERGRAAVLERCNPDRVVEHYQGLYDWLLRPDTRAAPHIGLPQEGRVRNEGHDGAL